MHDETLLNANFGDVDLKSIDDYYEPLIKETPDDQSLWESWGTELFNKKKFDKAVEKYEKAESLGSNTGELYWDWARALTILNQLDEAEKKFKKAEELTPDYGFLYLDWGNSLLAKKDYDGAIEKYRIAAGFEESKADAYYNIGLSFYSKKDYKSAKENFEIAITLNDKSPLYHYWLANTLSYLREAKASVAAYEESLKWETDDVNRYYTLRNLGFSLIELDEFDKAIENFEEAERLRDDEGFLYVYWGDALREKQEPQEAVKKYEIAARFEDTKLEALLKMGNTHYDQKEYKSAIKSYKRILAINKNEVNAHYNIGLSSYYSGDYKRAKQAFKQAIKQNDQNANYHTWLADTLSNLGELGGAVEEYKEALRLQTEPADKYFIYRNLGYALVKDDKFDEAIGNFEEAAKVREDDGFLYVYWGDALVGKKERDLAKEKYEIGAKSIESRTEALLKSGNIDYDEKNYEAAIEKYKTIISLEPENVFAHFNLGLSFYNIKEYKDAKEGFEQAVELNPEESLYHIWLADAYFNLKKYEEAADEYNAALRFESDKGERYSIYRSLGVTLGLLNDVAGADEAFRDAEKLRDSDGLLYLDWGDAFSTSYQFREAEAKYRHARKFPDARFRAWYASGYQSMFQRNYTEAIACFDNAILEKENDPLPYYDRAYCFFKIGQYSQANENWDKSYERFEAMDRKDEFNDVAYLYRFAIISHYIYGKLSKAKQLYGKISDDLQYLEKLDKLSNYIELRENSADEDHKYHWEAYHQFEDIKRSINRELTETSSKDESYYLYFYLGYLNFQMRFFEDAQKEFEKAYNLKISARTSKDASDDLDVVELLTQNAMRNALGSCYSARGEHEKAISFITRAKEEFPGRDFEIQNNLANTYFMAYYGAENDFIKTKYLNSAEKEYEKVLLLAPNNINAMIGLGYIKIEKAEFVKTDDYEEAKKHLERALKLSKSKKGSNRITNKVKTEILYALGYVYIKMYDNSSRFSPNETYRREANNYFQKVLEIDAYNQPALKACAYLKKEPFPRKPGTFVEKFAHLIISSLAFAVFVLSFTSFFLKTPKLDDMTVGYFIALIFGSLVFLVAGLSFPHLSKLKFGNIELEKEIEKLVRITEDFSFITKQTANFTPDIQGISKQVPSKPGERKEGDKGEKMLHESKADKQYKRSKRKLDNAESDISALDASAGSQTDTAAASKEQ